MPLPNGWEVRVSCGPGPQAGAAHLHERVIEIWPDWLPEDEELVSTLVHEYAHALDHEHMGVRERGLWSYARGLRGNWYACQLFVGGGERVDESCWDPSEDFAEAFAACLTGQSSWRFHTHEVEPPSRAECALALALVEEARLGVGVLAER